MKRITLAKARRIAIEFNRRLDEAYRRAAKAEAEADAAWERKQ